MEDKVGVGVSVEELELMEQRVAELEKYLGIEDYTGLALAKVDPIEKKSAKLDDFVKVLEDKHYIMGELFQRYEAMEGFLKRTTQGPQENDLRKQFLPYL